MRAFLLALGLIFTGGLGLQAENWEALTDRGEKAMQAGRYEAALTFFNAAILVAPEEPSTLAFRGNCYSEMGRLDDAIKDYDKGIEMAQSKGGADETKYLCFFYFNKAFAYDRNGKLAEAAVCYEKVIALDKTFHDAHGNLAWLLATSYDPKLRDPKRAVELAKIEGELVEWKIPAVVDTMAAAYAVDGNFDEAIKVQLEAIKLNTDPAEKKGMDERLELYRKKQPFVQAKRE